MRKDERYQLAESLGLIANIGRTVETVLPYVQFADKTAEIVGWSMLPVGTRSKRYRPKYVIRSENGECKMLLAGDSSKRCEEMLFMSGNERYQIAERLGLTANIGREVNSVHQYAFRSGEAAEIIGWCMVPRLGVPELTQFTYVIRFENGECDMIPSDESLEQSGFVFAN